ncbi:uncharacterized protein CLUP02_01794 [Colletotrichum lupini]|uniref:Uncharacterized protein n=1 Tax=Colletotrichum lupini TaxID=145971 RepID=A0A9Q8W9M4_9PEZI|nr:uncharacterized protein CLUP02_01794 [Colletotrichum lupini]UQC75141.1 hypothetical protein CLUP02_01794 [Colletotrichum lupini]
MPPGDAFFLTQQFHIITEIEWMDLATTSRGFRDMGMRDGEKGCESSIRDTRPPNPYSRISSAGWAASAHSDPDGCSVSSVSRVEGQLKNQRSMACPDDCKKFGLSHWPSGKRFPPGWYAGSLPLGLLMEPTHSLCGRHLASRCGAYKYVGSRDKRRQRRPFRSRHNPLGRGKPLVTQPTSCWWLQDRDTFDRTGFYPFSSVSSERAGIRASTVIW